MRKGSKRYRPTRGRARRAYFTIVVCARGSHANRFGGTIADCARSSSPTRSLHSARRLIWQCCDRKSQREAAMCVRDGSRRRRRLRLCAQHDSPTALLARKRQSLTAQGYVAQLEQWPIALYAVHAAASLFVAHRGRFSCQLGVGSWCFFLSLLASLIGACGTKQTLEQAINCDHFKRLPDKLVCQGRFARLRSGRQGVPV